jgi:hypothetical protein
MTALNIDEASILDPPDPNHSPELHSLLTLDRILSSAAGLPFNRD